MLNCKWGVLALISLILLPINKLLVYCPKALFGFHLSTQHLPRNTEVCLVRFWQRSFMSFYVFHSAVGSLLASTHEAPLGLVCDTWYRSIVYINLRPLLPLTVLVPPMSLEVLESSMRTKLPNNVTHCWDSNTKVWRGPCTLKNSCLWW